MRLSDDPLPHTLVQGPADDRREQRIRVGFRQPFEPQLRQPGQLVELARPTLREHEDDRLRLQAPRHEREHLRGRLIEPLRIVDQAEKRLFVGTVRQQTQQRRGRRKSDPAGRPSSSQRRSRAPHAGAAAAARARRATAHTTGEGPQTEAPSRTPPRPREEPGSLRHDRRCIPEALSSRSPPRRAAPAPRSAPRAWSPGADQAPGIRHAGPAASLNQIRASKKSFATRIRPRHRAKSSRPKNNLRPKSTASYRGHATVSGRRVLFAGETLGRRSTTRRHRPRAPSICQSNGVSRSARAGDVLPLRHPGFASPTLPRVRGPGSTTRDLTRDS